MTLAATPVVDSVTAEHLDELLAEVARHPDQRARALHHLLGEGPCRQLGIYPLPVGFKLSVVIPVFNEREYIAQIVDRVQAVPIPKEIIVVDDGSSDGTRAVLEEIGGSMGNVRVVLHAVNQGKGAAVRTGFAYAKGDVVLVQDADLEYDPAEYPRLLQPIIENQADVVFGSRFIGERHRVLYFWHSIANRTLTTLSNMFTNLNLTDMETCYKVFRRTVLADIRLKSDRHRSPKWRVYEIPVSYSGRTYEEGKKIGLKDAISALYCIFRYWLFD
jgi:glycosyltransferase involved in cell wall biosynthesis